MKKSSTKSLSKQTKNQYIQTENVENDVINAFLID